MPLSRPSQPAPRLPKLFRVRHHYRYVYTGPVFDVKQRLIMIPPDRYVDQQLLSFDLDVRGPTGHVSIDWQSDLFGNRICRVEAERVDKALDFEARFSVRRGDLTPTSDLELDPAQLHAYLSFSALTAPNEQVSAAARDIRGQASRRAEWVELAHDWAAQSITYQVGVTGTQTPAALALHLGQGVCQDYAHIMLSLLRTLEIPARYVSGHLIGEGAPHAWVEVLLMDADAGQPPRVLAFDPTHHRRVGQNYITVAVGRDFADVTSTSGVFSGAATGKLHWSKQAEVIEEPGSTQSAGAAA
ncbi:MAG: transglutaminase family protein [Chloroflexi bacterium]|nr:transglutaminase family protein [Chloroflexota bacterium]